MANKKLINELNQNLPKNLGKKVKLYFDEKKMNTSLLETLKNVFGTKSTKKLIETAFTELAISELNKQDSILRFPASDYMQKLESFNSEKGCFATMPSWNVVATSIFVKNKYSKLEFKSVEEVLDLVISFLADQTKSLWS